MKRRIAAVLRNKVEGNPRPCSSCEQESDLYVSICVPGTHINLCLECLEEMEIEISRHKERIQYGK